MTATTTTREVKSTCCYCGVGCGVLIETDGREIVGVRGDPDHPANRGMLCSKGATLHLTARAELRELRVHYPSLRRARSAARERASWDDALDHAADRFAAIVREHGPDAVAFYVSGQLLTEDYYVFNKLAKGLIGTNNIDTNSRLCMSSAVAGYKATLGADAPPCSYEDLDHADCVLIAGSNMAYAHPVLYRRLEAARAARPAVKVVVVDPRRTDTAREATLHLPILPGTDVALFHAMLHVMIWEGLVDQTFVARHTSGFEALRELVRDATPASAARTCGVDANDIVSAARWFATARASLSLYCQGLNQSTSGTAKNAALINLHLATGHIGRAGAGPFSLTGQPNAMGGREVGGLANLLSAHRDLGDATHRAEVAALWGVDDVPARPGKTAVEMFDALGTGAIKAIWIACTNPAQSLPDQRAVRAALARAALVVVQEAYADTETVAFADVLLPATSWGEKDGTVTNSERRITRLHAAVPGPGEARADWAIAADFARRLEARLRPGPAMLFPYARAEDVWNEHRETTRGRDLDITGLSYALLDSLGPQQWPLRAGAPTGTPRLYTDGVFATADGRAKFAATPYRTPAERPDAKYPLTLNTGRLRDQWHTLARSGSIARAYSHAPEPTLAMTSADLARRGIASGELVRVASTRGAIHVIAVASDEQRSGQAFLAMHWGARFLAGVDAHGVNTLTSPAFDPVSKQPELKIAVVHVAKAELPWRLAAFGFASTGSALALADRLATIACECAFVQATLIGRDREGVLLRLAAGRAPAPHVLAAIDALLALDRPHALRYDDPRRGVARRIAIEGGTLAAVRLSGPLDALAAEGWLRDQLVRGDAVEPIRRWLLAPSGRAPTSRPARGRVVCNCWNVAESEIRAALDTARVGDDALAAIQRALRCGTSCGSCLPELKAMLRTAAPVSEAA